MLHILCVWHALVLQNMPPLHHPPSFEFYLFISLATSAGTCSTGSQSIGAKVDVDGTCWQHVHPLYNSVIDFSYWTLTYSNHMNIYLIICTYLTVSHYLCVHSLAFDPSDYTHPP